MAKGDYFTFNKVREDLGNGIYALSTDLIRFALIKSLANGGIDPSVSTADPRWGPGGGTNLKSSEVNVSGNYSVDGDVVAATWVLVGGTATFDTADNTWDQDNANPTNARWCIVYSDTAAGNQCLGYIDIGSDFDMSTGPLVIETPNDIFNLS